MSSNPRTLNHNEIDDVTDVGWYAGPAREGPRRRLQITQGYGCDIITLSIEQCVDLATEILITLPNDKIDEILARVQTASLPPPNRREPTNGKGKHSKRKQTSRRPN